MIFYEGKVAKFDVVNKFVVGVMRDLNIHRFRAKHVEIRFLNKCDGDAAGYAYSEGDPNFIVVEIAKNIAGHKQPFEEMLKVLAHELVHVKQHFRKEWFGEEELYEGVDYYDLPWEVEAYARENELFENNYGAMAA